MLSHMSLHISTWSIGPLDMLTHDAIGGLEIL